jgi:hypothetical protein
MFSRIFEQNVQHIEDCANETLMWRLILLVAFLLAGCTIPAEVFFRNFSAKKVRLQATLIDRSRFDKLPNKVTFYDTATRKHLYYGNWRSNGLVTWVDTATFYVDVPAYTVINLADVSNGLTLGSRQPEVLLLLIADNKTDTLTTGDYPSLALKFTQKGYNPLGTVKYYYDFR